jgi:cytochrome c biogenesis protein
MAANSGRIGRKTWQALSSVKTGVVLLIVTVVVAAAGTLILQRSVTDPEEMQRAYSPQVLRVLDAVGLTDVYHTWWFILLLALVSISIVAASVDRFPNAFRFFSRPYKSPTETFRKSLSTQKTFATEDEEEGVLAANLALRRAGLKPELVVTEERVSLFAERNRMSEMAVYVVHASLLLIFAGGIIDGLLGWSGSMNLLPAQQQSQIELRNGGVRTLPFAIRCESAGQENYKDGSPKKWWSNLVVVKDGRDVVRKQIVVNDPLVYQGVRFYQSSFGPTGQIDKLILNATSPAGGAAREIMLGINETAPLDADTSVRLAEFIPDYTVRDGHVYTRSNDLENPAAHLVVEANHKSVDVWLPPLEGFDQSANSPYKFEAKGLKMGYFTGLQVSHEPGQWAVWGGVVLMGVGLGFVFYLVHMRFWVVPVRDARGHLALWVGGTANKNREAFEERFQEVTEAIEKALQENRVASEPEHATQLAG